MTPQSTTITVLPGELRIGDRLIDFGGEWVVTSGPWTMASAKTVYVFGQHLSQPGRRREFAWPEDAAVTIQREI